MPAEVKNRSYDVIEDNFNQFRDDIEGLMDLGTEDFKSAVIYVLQDMLDIQEETLRKLLEIEEYMENRMDRIEAMFEEKNRKNKKRALKEVVCRESK